MPQARRSDPHPDLGPRIVRARGARIVGFAPDPDDPDRTIRRAWRAWSCMQLYAQGRLPLSRLQAAERWRDTRARAAIGTTRKASLLNDGIGGDLAGLTPAEAVMHCAADYRRARAALAPTLAVVMDLAAGEELSLCDLAARLRLTEERASEAVLMATGAAARHYGTE